MASLTQENSACIEGFDNFEFSQVDGALLMSFLDDTQVLEDCDDERLTTVMRSLEAEIDLHVADDKNSFQDSTWTSTNSSDHHKNKEGLENSSSNMLNCNWMDIEMEMKMETEEAVASLSSDLMASWYMDPTTEHKADGAEDHRGFGKIDQKDYFDQLSNDYGISFEDHDQGCYATLWQETNYASLVHG